MYDNSFAIFLCVNVDPPEYTLVGTVPNSFDVGASVIVRFIVDGNPTPQDPILIKDGFLVPLNRTTPAVNETTITNLQCDDAGQYTLQSSNAAGVGSGTFLLNITYSELKKDKNCTMCIFMLVVIIAHYA